MQDTRRFLVFTRPTSSGSAPPSSIEMPPDTTEPLDEPAESWGWVGGAVIGLLLIGLFVPVPGRFLSPWVGCLEDLVHVPLFGLLAWLIWRVANVSALTASGLALGLAIIVEPIQSLVGRSASLGDVVRGACGIAIFLSWRAAASLPTQGARTLVRLTSVALAAGLPIAEAWPTLSDAAAAWRAFPVLADFSSSWQSNRWVADGCSITCQEIRPGRGVGVLQCGTNGSSTPALVLFPILRDWSRFRALHIDFTVEGDPLPITLSVRDGRHVDPPLRRFDLGNTYPRGRQVMTIDLQQIARGSAVVAPVNVSAVQSLHIIVDAGNATRPLRLERIWLD